MHDNVRYGDIASNPQDWISNKLSQYKTILVESECAVVQYQQPHKTESIYKIPDSLDNHFLYALRIISDKSDIAKKLLLVNFNFDQNDYATFKLLNPYTR